MCTQTFLIIMWFTNAIISSGSKNGWTKFGKFKHCLSEGVENNFEFAKFLTVVEIFLYYLCMCLGIRCVYKVYTDEKVTSDPFEKEPGQEMQEGV